MKKVKIACIGNYPPRECGIATFTRDVVDSVIKNPDIENIDPEAAEKIAGNLLRVKKLDVETALKKYGKEMHH